MGVNKISYKQLELLRSLPLADLGFCGALVLLAFGSCRQTTSLAGKKVLLYDHNLHVTCGWRFIRNGQILLGSDDIYHRGGTDIRDPEPGETSVWQTKRQLILSGQLGKMTVADLDIGPFQSISLLFENGIRFQAVPLESPDSSDTELWRAFATGIDCHLIAKGGQIYLEGEEHQSVVE